MNENLDDLPMEQWPDDRLLRAAISGNDRAFELFCVRRLPGLERYLRRKCADLGVPVDLAYDFVQETLLKALDQVRSTVDGGEHPLPRVSVAWLSQVGYNLIRDWRRKNRRIQTVDNIELVESTYRAGKEASKETTERYEEVLNFFNWLQPDDRELLELVLIEEVGIVEAGSRIGLSVAASYKRYERALQHLRDLLDEHGKGSRS